MITDVALPMVVPTSYVFGDGLSLFIAFNTKYITNQKNIIIIEMHFVHRKFHLYKATFLYTYK